MIIDVGSVGKLIEIIPLIFHYHMPQNFTEVQNRGLHFEYPVLKVIPKAFFFIVVLNPIISL